MSYVQCPDCGKQIEVFGKSHVSDLAKMYDVKSIAKIPFDASLTQCADRGLIELFEGEYLTSFFQDLEKGKK